MALPCEWLCDITSAALDGRAANVQESPFLYATCWPGEWLWVDSNGTNGKPTFRRRANQSWCSATCNHFAVIAAWSRWRCSCKSWPFWKKTPYGQIFTNVFPKGSPSLRSTSCGQILWNLAHQKLVKSCIIYVKKNKILAHFCVDHAQNLSEPAPGNTLAVPQISSKFVHFRGSYSRTRERRSNAPQRVSNTRRSFFAEWI